MGRYSVKRHNKEPKEVNAVEWVMTHREDIPMAKENLAARDKGFDDDAVRNLFAAISLRACADYKLACEGVQIGSRYPEETMDDCHKFFDSDIFQYFINRIPVEEIERKIKETPKGQIETLIRQG